MEFGIKPVNNDKIVLIEKGGYETFRSMIPVWYRRKIAVIIVYESSSRKSFEELGVHLEQVEIYAKEDILRAIVANKSDLAKEVSTEEGRDYAEKYGHMFFEVSAKTGEGI